MLDIVAFGTMLNLIALKQNQVYLPLFSYFGTMLNMIVLKPRV